MPLGAFDSFVTPRSTYYNQPYFIEEEAEIPTLGCRLRLQKQGCSLHSSGFPSCDATASYRHFLTLFGGLWVGMVGRHKGSKETQAWEPRQDQGGTGSGSQKVEEGGCGVSLGFLEESTAWSQDSSSRCQLQ